MESEFKMATRGLSMDRLGVKIALWALILTLIFAIFQCILQLLQLIQH